MSQICKCCQRAPAVKECPICKRWYCMLCGDNHNCYPREGHECCTHEHPCCTRP